MQAAAIDRAGGRRSLRAHAAGAETAADEVLIA